MMEFEYKEFVMNIFGVDTEVYAKIGNNSCVIVCATKDRYCIYRMNGIPTLEMNDIQESFYEEKFNFVLNMLK